MIMLYSCFNANNNTCTYEHYHPRNIQIQQNSQNETLIAQKTIILVNIWNTVFETIHIYNSIVINLECKVKIMYFSMWNDLHCHKYHKHIEKKT